MKKIFTGKVWKRKKIDTADIISNEIWLKNLNHIDPAILGQFAMATIDKEFASKAINGDFRIVVSGKNFGGGGKSYEHGIIALKSVGIVLVIAESFARYAFRNAINNGLPVLECDGIFEAVGENDILEVDISTGIIKNLTSQANLQANPLPGFVLEILEAGSYISYIAGQTKKEEKKTITMER